MRTRFGESGDHYKTMVRAALLDEKDFVGLTLSGRRHEEATRWTKIRLRPILIGGHREMQFSYFDDRRCFTRNLSGEELQQELDEVLAVPFSRIHARSASGDIHVRITRKGKALVTKGKASGQRQAPSLLHDHIKRYPLPLDIPDAFLESIGVMNSEGKVRASMWRKFRQINEFLRVIEQTLPQGERASQPIHVMDCGCGSAHLTFGAYHYLSHTQGVPVHLVGVDTNRELIDKCCQLRDSLDWPGLDFRVSSIVDFVPSVPPDMVLSLHACDTATDEAIAQGILWGSRVILAAPCCQHELHRQLRSLAFRPLLRHGVLRERLADLLTDTFRALVLRIMGYRTRVIEFVSPEYTSKNLMIRAERGLRPGDTAYVQEYNDLKSFWSVSPVIEELLGEDMQRLLER